MRDERKVSIPYRYGTSSNKAKRTNDVKRCRFVSIPYRYGTSSNM